MNPRTRRIALHAIGVIAILASVNALTHSYAGLYDWAAHHRLAGWQAMSWPAEIDVFLAIGELSLYVAYLDGWDARHRFWPWATALAGLSVSVAGNIGHIQPVAGHPVVLADRLTAATSPLAAFAGLSIGLLVLKMTREQQRGNSQALPVRPQGTAPLPASAGLHLLTAGPDPAGADPAPEGHAARSAAGGPSAVGCLLEDAGLILQAAAADGVRLSQRALARELRRLGHRFPNEHLHDIAASAGLTPAA
jgi:hypothetical protein